jgi:hypothetical protein
MQDRVQLNYLDQNSCRFNLHYTTVIDYLAKDNQLSTIMILNHLLVEVFHPQFAMLKQMYSYQ